MLEKPIKEGSTFDEVATYRVAKDGESLTLDGLTITANVREPNYNLVTTLTVTVLEVSPDDVDTRGKFRLFKLSTTGWPLKRLYCDIKITNSDDVVVHSDTFAIPVGRSET